MVSNFLTGLASMDKLFEAILVCLPKMKYLQFYGALNGVTKDSSCSQSKDLEILHSWGQPRTIFSIVLN